MQGFQTQYLKCIFRFLKISSSTFISFFTGGLDGCGSESGVSQHPEVRGRWMDGEVNWRGGRDKGGRRGGCFSG